MAENPQDPAPALNGDMIEQILLRLPAAAIHRCRGVCREWRALTTDGNFITAHREHHPLMPLFFYRRDLANDGAVRVELQALDLAAREPLPVVCFLDVPNTGDVSSDHTESEDDEDLNDLPDPMAVQEELDLIPDPVAGEENLNHPAPMGEDERDSLFIVHGSCDGLLLLSYADILYVCNPSTRHWARLPPIHGENGIIGFYACGPPSGEGKVLYRILYHTGGFGQLQNWSYWIRVLGPLGMETVHNIGRPMSPVTPPEVDFLLFDGVRPAYEEPPTVVHGNLHWLSQVYAFMEINMIAVFNTAAEEFKWIRPPLLPDDPCGGDDSIDFGAGAFQLLETQGMLAMAIINATRTLINIWVLHDYANEVWDIRHQIHMPGAAITASIGYDEIREPPGYVVSLNRDVMVLVPSPRTLLQCDANGVVLKHHRRSQDWTICTPHVYQESFVVHDFLMGQGNDDGRLFLLLSPGAFLEQYDA